MDIASIGGLAISFGSLLIAVLLVGGDVRAFFHLDAMFIIFGGTIGATMFSFPMPVFINGFTSVMRNAFFSRGEVDYTGTIGTLVNFASKARREGLLGLEEDVNQLEDKFLQKGMQLVVDGTDIELVRHIMETDLSFLQSRHKQGGDIFTAMGGYSPTLGIVGTVMGLIDLLARGLDDPAAMVKGISTAFGATLLGIGTANLVWLPLAGKLKVRSEEEILLREMMIEGVCSISAGDNPRIVEEKLKAFLPPKLRAVAIAGGGRDEKEAAPAAPAAAAKK
ncbi:MAG: flagellar motor protein [Candidatus Coatesbacteria bacterium]